MALAAGDAEDQRCRRAAAGLALGLGLGLLGVEWIGVAAGAGPVLFYLGAVARHLRTRVFRTMPFPLTYRAFAIGSLILVIAVR